LPISVRVLAALVLVALVLPGSALAQAYQCRAPASLGLGKPPKPDGPVIRKPISGYTFALSWSPEFCRTRARDPGQAVQCSGASGRFGFVVHGLWPEAKNGPAPQWCSLTPRPKPATIRGNLCISPSAALIEHEWAKHGSCMASSAEGYYRVVGILWHSLRFPEMERLSRQDNLTAGELRSQFVTLNPGWRADAVGIQTSRNGWLREVQLCYDRKFMPSPCPRRTFGAGDKARLKIWRGL
jgi:ribonuclease T2